MKDFERECYLDGFARAAEMIDFYNTREMLPYISNAIHCLDNFLGTYAQGYRDGISVSGIYD